jgi:predicted nucleic acid-binding protein
MPYLFDTDAISELIKRKPAPGFIRWVASIPREDQFVSAITIGELYQGAYASTAEARHIDNIESRLLPAVTILPFDTAVAKVFGRIRAERNAAGKPLEDADLQIAATALHHQLTLVTGNLKHFHRVADLSLSTALHDARE